MRDLAAYNKLVKARTRMILSLPFIAASVMVLDLIEDYSVKTAETDGNYIYYNPLFILPLNLKQTMWLLAHESLHCVLLHHTRVGGRDFKLWNVAADYVINLILNDIIEFQFIQGCMLDLKFLNMATEEVYNILHQLSDEQKQELKDKHQDAGGFRKAESAGSGKDKKKDKGDASGKDTAGGKKDDIGKGGKSDKGDGKKEDGGADGQNGSSGEGREKGNGKGDSNQGVGKGGSEDGDPTPLPTDILSQEEKWQIFSKQSMDVAEKIGGRNMGWGTPNLKRLVEKIVSPSVPWNQLLYIFVDQTAKDEYDWNIPNKRYISWGYYLPTLHSEKLGYVVVVIDTSGSIKQSDLDRFASEIMGIREAYECKVMVIYCDSAINEQSIQIFEEEDEIILRPTGGGGTDFRPPFTYIERENMEADIKCLIYFTDGVCNRYPTVPPDFPVLWVGLRKFEPKFGDFVLMEAA